MIKAKVILDRDLAQNDPLGFSTHPKMFLMHGKTISVFQRDDGQYSCGVFVWYKHWLSFNEFKVRKVWKKKLKRKLK